MVRERHVSRFHVTQNVFEIGSLSAYLFFCLSTYHIPFFSKTVIPVDTKFGRKGETVHSTVPGFQRVNNFRNSFSETAVPENVKIACSISKLFLKKPKGASIISHDFRTRNRSRVVYPLEYKVEIRQLNTYIGKQRDLTFIDFVNVITKSMKRHVVGF